MVYHIGSYDYHHECIITAGTETVLNDVLSRRCSKNCEVTHYRKMSDLELRRLESGDFEV